VSSRWPTSASASSSWSPDVRDVPEAALDGVDDVINPSGLSNDPTAELDPEANWQMNAIATETLGRMCVERGIERYVFASSCSLYDGMPPGMHDETADIQPRAAYATSKRYGEERVLEMVAEGLCPVLLRNGTVYGYGCASTWSSTPSPRTRCSTASCSCTAAAGCGARSSTCATSPTP
jgi:nucleoside-diphosphate-sugar epimerase